MLYLERAEWHDARQAFMTAMRGLEGQTRPWWPPLTLRLAPGVAFAEDPGNDESFGQCRCRILAPAVTTMVEHLDDPDDRHIDRLQQALAAAGMDPERPWMNGKG